jgi:transposase InsO family protein
MKKTTSKQRLMMYEQHQAGKTYGQIAQEYGLSFECVRYWCRRQRDHKGVDTVFPNRDMLHTFHPLVRYGILRLRLEHMKWGPIRIRFHLEKRPSLKGLGLPSPAQIGRYLHQWKRFRRKPKLRLKEQKPGDAVRPHQRWQIDFKIHIPSTTGRGQLFTAIDETSGVCIGARLFPNPTARPRLEDVVAFLRYCFNRWGLLPEEIQTDGETCLVGRIIDHPFPARFTLWLAGLGIAHRVIPSRKPTVNSEVERGHRTLNEYVLICRRKYTCDEINAQLEQATHELSHLLPSQAKECRGRPPVIAYPGLLEPHRPYHSTCESQIFSMSKVDVFLAKKAWLRGVESTGQITIGEQHRYSVGRKYAGSLVLIRFDSSTRFFCFYTYDEKTFDPLEEIGRRPVRGLEAANLNMQQVTTLAPLPLQLPLQLFWPEGVDTHELIGV